MTEQITQPTQDLVGAQKAADAKKGKGKRGREKRKKERRGSPISLYVRNKITAEAYFKATGQSVKR